MLTTHFSSRAAPQRGQARRRHRPGIGPPAHDNQHPRPPRFSQNLAQPRPHQPQPLSPQPPQQPSRRRPQEQRCRFLRHPSRPVSRQYTLMRRVPARRRPSPRPPRQTPIPPDIVTITVCLLTFLATQLRPRPPPLRPLPSSRPRVTLLPSPSHLLQEAYRGRPRPELYLFSMASACLVAGLAGVALRERAGHAPRQPQS